MAYTTSHAPPLMDATHAWNPAGAGAPPVLNDCNATPRVLPQVVLTGCENYYALPDQVANVVGKTVGVGTVRDPPRELGKTIVYTGYIEAADRYSLATVLGAMGRGFGDRVAEGVMTVTPWPKPGPVSGGVVWTFSGLVTDMKPDATWVLEDSGLFVWGFSLTINMSDPIMYTSGATYP